MNEQVHRLRTLLFLVPFVYRHRGVPVVELARRLGMDEKALTKEIDFLLMVGRPPFQPNDMIDIYVEGSRVFVDLPQALEKPPSFTLSESLALASAAQLFAGEETMGKAAVAVRMALNKVVESLPEESRALFEELAERYLVLSGDALTPVLSRLREAVDARQEVRISHHVASRDELRERVVQPYGLHHRAGAWYLVAFCTDREDMRIFRLSRIRSAELLDRIFDLPTDFDTASFVEKRLTLPIRGQQKIRLRFEPEVARWVSERWDERYLEPCTDGGLIASLHDVSDEFVLTYVASFAGRASILEPADLAGRLAAEAKAALAAYQS